MPHSNALSLEFLQQISWGRPRVSPGPPHFPANLLMWEQVQVSLTGPYSGSLCAHPGDILPWISWRGSKSRSPSQRPTDHRLCDRKLSLPDQTGGWRRGVQNNLCCSPPMAHYIFSPLVHISLFLQAWWWVCHLHFSFFCFVTCKVLILF